MFCYKCGNKAEDGDVFCRVCGCRLIQEGVSNVVATNNDDALIHPVTETKIVVNDRWLWAIAVIPLCVDIILNVFFGRMTFAMVLGNVISNEYLSQIAIVNILVVWALNCLFFGLDVKECRDYGYNPGDWMWLGLILIPVYLFIRAAKTTKNVFPGIVWCVIFIISVFVDMNLPIV